MITQLTGLIKTLGGLFIPLLLCCQAGNAQTNESKAPCGADVMFRRFLPDSTERSEARMVVEKNIRQYVRGASELHFRGEIVVPVVVHIVWFKEEENVSDEIIFSQIEALNRDFLAENGDLSRVPQEFKGRVASTGIRFCLAARAPDGSATNGIVRVRTDMADIGLNANLFYTASGGSDAWDTNQYLNIWVASTGTLLAGFASYPGLSEPEKSGVVIHPKYFGINNHKYYGLGRTAVHETGHYFGLIHTWGDDDLCETDDSIPDTPLQLHAYTGCPDYPQQSCNESSMFMNFMDYVNDPCMYMFTEGQKQRMRAVIELYRPGLLHTQIVCNEGLSEGSDDFDILPNPAVYDVTIRFRKLRNTITRYEIYNSTGQLVCSKTLSAEQEFTISVDQLPKGIYAIKIQSQSHILIKI